MEQSYQNQFSRATLTGVFAGIVTTLICLGYNFYYRDETGFPLSGIINVSSLIFGVNIIFLALGMGYSFFLQSFRKLGELFYIILSIGLTVWAALTAIHMHRSDDPLLNNEFHHLLLVMIIIIGVVAAAGVPILFHNKKFQDAVI